MFYEAKDKPCGTLFKEPINYYPFLFSTVGKLCENFV